MGGRPEWRRDQRAVQRYTHVLWDRAGPSGVGSHRLSPIERCMMPRSLPVRLNFYTYWRQAKRLKTLKGLTPYEYICRAWRKEPERFTLNPLQRMPGLNT